jgi:hypothetical protein
MDDARSCSVILLATFASCPSAYPLRTVYPDGKVCISILHPPGVDEMSGELPEERWLPTQVSCPPSALSLSLPLVFSNLRVRVCAYG